MNQKELRTTFSHPTPELLVTDVERAQQYYRDALGFEIRWLEPGKEIGAVPRDNVAIFLRRRSQPFEPAVHWVFAADIEATHHPRELHGAATQPALEPRETAHLQRDFHGDRRTHSHVADD